MSNERAVGYLTDLKRNNNYILDRINNRLDKENEPGIRRILERTAKEIEAFDIEKRIRQINILSDYEQKKIEILER